MTRSIYIVPLTDAEDLAKRPCRLSVAMGALSDFHSCPFECDLSRLSCDALANRHFLRDADGTWMTRVPVFESRIKSYCEMDYFDLSIDRNKRFFLFERRII